jgi:hypothetical protein
VKKQPINLELMDDERKDLEAFLNTAPDHLKADISVLLYIATAVAMLAENHFAVVPFHCSDKKWRWAIFQSSSQATVAEDTEKQVKAVLAMDLSPISKDLGEDVTEAVHHASLHVMTVSRDVN